MDLKSDDRDIIMTLTHMITHDKTERFHEKLATRMLRI